MHYRKKRIGRTRNLNPKSLEHLLEDKWIHKLLSRLSNRERECFMNNIHNYNILHDSKYGEAFLDLKDIKCMFCPSELLCFAIMLGMVERKATLLGMSDEVEEKIINTIEKFLLP